jgi:carbamoyltransferase
MLGLNHTRDERENYTATREFLARSLMPARRPDEEVTDDHRDAAAALQESLARAILHICSHFQKETGLRTLALAGGVALNCTANGKLVRSGFFDEVYIQPVAGDDGVAYGAALYRASLAGEVVNRRFPVPLYGPLPGKDAIAAALNRFADRIEVTPCQSVDQTCTDAASLIARAGDRLVPRPDGIWPRTGNRSIWQIPGPEMDRINAMVKKREAFRPLLQPFRSIRRIGGLMSANDGMPYDHHGGCAREPPR